MKACLLAAGRGTRLGLGDDPKTLVPLMGRPLLHYILDSLKPYEFEEIVVVGGHCAAKLAQSLQEHPSVRSTLVINGDFHQGSILSVAAAKENLMGSDFLLMNSDHLYSSAIHQRIRESLMPRDLTVVYDTDRPLGEDDMKISLIEGRFERMAKDLKGPGLPGYVGLSLIPAYKQNLYWKAVSDLIDQGQTQLNVEGIINHLALRGEGVGILDISGSHWIEIDTPEDLRAALQKLPLVCEPLAFAP